MNGRLKVWPLAAAVSVAAHVALLAGLVLVLRPARIPRQPMPETRIDIAAHQVDRSDAIAQSAMGDRVSQAIAPGQGLAGTAIPASYADALPVDPERVTGLAVAPSAAVSLSTTGKAAPSAFLRPASVTATPASPVKMAALSPATTVTAALPATDPAARAFALIQRAGPAETTAAAPAGGTDLPRIAPETQQITPAAADAPARPELSSQNIATRAAPLPPSAEHVTAALAWSGDESRAVDPLSLAAIQAFMQPAGIAAFSADATALRDGLAATLRGVPCARLQTVFRPETGALELRGHVPDDSLRGPVLAALQRQVGPAIPIEDRLLILPHTQCQALTGIAATGLAQSTEKATNPRIVGADAYARDYRYTPGQRLALDVQAPDYDSVIYVDYFDADGNVLHIQPNDIVALEHVAPRSLLAIGREQAGKPSLDLVIAPPYGQEIAVAFATSDPLYDGLRPLVEPAGPYLAFLRDRVSVMRAEKPDFKGEWVYFFITTAAD